MPRFVNLLLAPAIAMSALVASTPAQAQITIVDVDSYANALRTLKIIDQQIQQLQNDAQKISMMQSNLRKIDFPELQQLAERMRKIDALLGQAQAIQFDATKVSQQFGTLFPAADANAGGAARAAQAKAQLDAALASFRHTMEVQAQVAQNVSADAAALAELAARSQGAEGALQVAQAGNQLSALATKQQMAIQQLLAAQFRAEALDRTRAAQSELDGRAATRKFLGSGTAYTPR